MDRLKDCKREKLFEEYLKSSAFYRNEVYCNGMFPGERAMNRCDSRIDHWWAVQSCFSRD